MLPASGGWLVWDKGQRINQSDGELAYTSRDCALRIFEQNRVALMVEGAQHPTQKPLSVMRRSILQFPEAQTILDPFCGSGSTLVACQALGRAGTGIERDPDYFEVMCRRVDEAARQPDLLVPETYHPPTQEQLL
jgi:DNA modification methylase